ncbi:unnamed protein product [Chondrus crispus]|uniref:Uncharacterized protein n=1 Tax=Chondrus crispus TaxID=2769 RepID=R7QAY8_CHOCR|nr:unnamed protein product [Chondrus crispus]CDF34625.1 unnamed protein product [Chondrus crispus]|eukprot:XP_005714444.1 unnamed protein product [Chondrus crispus]
MRSLRRIVAFYTLSLFANWLTAGATAVLITQALRGKVFGSPDSNDVAKQIVVGADGSMYVAGVSTPSRPGGQAWGDPEAGDVLGNTDIFLAKFTASTELAWVKRTGSAGEDVVNDLVMAGEALYLCGATTGNLAMDPRGSSDAFVMKFTVDGAKAWRHPFQFGSNRNDSCNALSVDRNSMKIYVTGSTMGILFGSIQPRNTTTHHFLASFSEIQNNETLGLQLIQGRQTASSGNSSGDAIAIGNNHVLLMTTEWEDVRKRYRTVTYLRELSLDTLLDRKLHMIKSLDEGSFRATGMAAVNMSGDVFFVGTTNLDTNKTEYHALKYSLKNDDAKSSSMWTQRIGSVASNVKMPTQTPCIVADEANDVVYVAGVEDGYLPNENSSVVISPLIMLRMDNGEVAQRWHRSTTIAFDKEEITDIAFDLEKGAVYTGTWDGGVELLSNALVGSFGSRALNLSLPSAPPARNPNVTVTSIEAKEEAKRSRTIGYILLGLASTGIAVTGMIAYGLRAARGKGNGSDDHLPDAANKMEEMRRQVLEAHLQAGGDHSAVAEVTIGGSAAPR